MRGGSGHAAVTGEFVQGQILDQHELITYGSNCETMSSLTNVHGTVLQVKQF